MQASQRFAWRTLVNSTNNGEKIKVIYWMRSCAFELHNMSTTTHLNLLPLGAYNLLLGMDWLYTHRTKVDCYEKKIECLNDVGERKFL